MKITLNMKEKRKEKGMSQQKLANIIGVHQTNISEYERGTQLPSMEHLIMLAEALEMTLDELVLYKKAHKLYNNQIEKK